MARGAGTGSARGRNPRESCRPPRRSVWRPTHPLAEPTLVRRAHDLRTAAVLAAAFALAAAVTVPLLLPSLPPEARTLPLPLTAFCIVLAVQLLLIYGLFAFTGLRHARAAGLDPAPFLTPPGDEPGRPRAAGRLVAAFAIGLAAGVALLLVVAAIQRWLPGTLPKLLHPPGIAAALAASTAASFGEEILFRLLLIGLLLRFLPSTGPRKAIAVAVSALAFGAAHAPAAVFLFGGWQQVPPLSWVWVMVLNGALGVTFGVVFLRHGIECAVLAHLGTDIVWHAASQCFRAAST